MITHTLIPTHLSLRRASTTLPLYDDEHNEHCEHRHDDETSTADGDLRNSNSHISLHEAPARTEPLDLRPTLSA